MRMRSIALLILSSLFATTAAIKPLYQDLLALDCMYYHYAILYNIMFIIIYLTFLT